MAPPASFEDRLQRISSRLFAYGMALTRDRDRASDLFQDAVLRAISARAIPDGDRQFQAWLFVILRNLWIDQARERQREADLRDGLAGSGDGGAGVPSLDGAIVNQMAVRQAFGALSMDHRDILALVDIAGFRYDEAAEILSIPRGTVMSRVSRARQALARLLQDTEIAELPRSARQARRDR